MRHKLFGTVDIDLSTLTEHPMWSITLSPAGAAEVAASAAAEAAQDTAH